MKHANQPTEETSLWETLSDEELETVVGGFMSNFFKQGKDQFFEAVGGDNNPFAQGMKQMETFFWTDSWTDSYQEQMHDMFIESIEQATGAAKNLL